jgi:hypothetical protein
MGVMKFRRRRKDKNRLVLAVAISAVALASCANNDAGTAPGAPVRGKPASVFHHIHGLAVDKSGALYVATHAGLIRGTGDRDWVYVSADRNDHMGFSLDPKSGTMFRSGHPVTGGSLGVESSPDGDMWRKLSNVLEKAVDFHAMTVSYAGAETLYGWDSQTRAAFRSNDGGQTWKRLSMTGADGFVYSFAATTDAVFAGTPSGLFRSSDGTGIWKRITSLGDGYVVSIAADPSDPNHLLAFTERGMKFTTDGGVTWAPSLGGIPPKVAATSLAISPVDGKIAYASDAVTIFKTVDGGKSWTVIRRGS